MPLDQLLGAQPTTRPRTRLSDRDTVAGDVLELPSLNRVITVRSCRELASGDDLHATSVCALHYPGHGDDSTLGAELSHLDGWRARGW